MLISHRISHVSSDFIHFHSVATIHQALDFFLARRLTIVDYSVFFCLVVSSREFVSIQKDLRLLVIQVRYGLFDRTVLIIDVCFLRRVIVVGRGDFLNIIILSRSGILLLFQLSSIIKRGWSYKSIIFKCHGWKGAIWNLFLISDKTERSFKVDTIGGALNWHAVSVHDVLHVFMAI